MSLSISERQWELIDNAVNEGMMMLQQEALIPFALVMRAEGVSLQRFRASDTGEALDKAERSLKASDEDVLAYVLVYDALLDIDGKERDVLLLEAGERSASSAYRFAQRYQAGKAKMPPYAVGQLIFLGKAETYLAEPKAK